MRQILLAATCVIGLGASAASAGVSVRTYGDMDLVGFGFPAGADPTAGAALSGLAPGASSFATGIYPHSFPFGPSVGDFPGTDQIYVGSTQTGQHDGYSGAASGLSGPQVLVMDIAGLVPAGEAIDALTLGIAADDFQNAVFGQPFSVSINGVPQPLLTSTLNGLNQTTPLEQLITFGLPTSLAAGSTLTLTIDEGGDGGDGWAVDYLTVGVTTSVVPEPGMTHLIATLATGPLLLRRRR